MKACRGASEAELANRVGRGARPFLRYERYGEGFDVAQAGKVSVIDIDVRVVGS